MRLRLNQGFLLASLLAGIGCSLGDEARAEVTYTPQANLPGSAFRVSMDDGGSTRTFRAADMIVQPDHRSLSTPVIETETSGTLTISYALGMSNAVVSEGVLTLALRDDWVWGARFEIDSLNPTRFCIGCFGSKAFPLAAAYRRVPSDSVWVTWGGNSIKNPVVY